jgi:hypothetical protein
MPTYPYAPPTLSGDVESINRFLNDTPEIFRQLRTIIQQRFIGGKILKGRYTTSNGAVIYDTSESIYADNDPTAVAPGSKYPVTPISTGAASITNTVEWGNSFLATDQAISRLKFDVIRRGMTKLANSHAKKLDSVALTAISSAVTQTTATATSGGWNGGAADLILADVALAKANVDTLSQGYMPDTVVVDPLHLAYAMIAFVKAGVLPRESLSENPALTGVFPVIDGMTWLSSPNVPLTTSALVLDSSMLGGWVDEHIGGPGWVGDPQDDTEGLEVNSLRLFETHSFKVEARRVTVPIIQEPAAAWKVTGV